MQSNQADPHQDGEESEQEEVQGGEHTNLLGRRAAQDEHQDIGGQQQEDA